MNERQYTELLWAKEFGVNLQRVLHRKGVTQGYLAKELNTSDAVISRYITGTVVPSAYRACQIAEVLGCDVSELVKTGYDN